MPATLLHTPLYERHVELGARMVPFAGWEMPVQYAGVIPEHRAVRADAGVFDVSHMGEVEVEGPKAEEMLQPAWLCDVSDAQAALGEPIRTDFRSGARKTWDWYVASGWIRSDNIETGREER